METTTTPDTTTTTALLIRLGRQVETAEASLTSQRAALTRLSDDLVGSHDLALALAAVAKAEGALEFWARAQLAFSRDDAPTIQEYLLEILDTVCMGADDTWSGRTNDARRSKFDGYREAARSFGQIVRVDRIIRFSR